jgi:NTP pyrophosphatase (non-canonical NTP hydrolase)
VGATQRRVQGGATQRRVRHVMAQVGGYWPPLAAVARLLEELGELSELLGLVEPPTHELASELADVWIITAALADQFLGEVAEPGDAGGASALAAASGATPEPGDAGASCASAPAAEPIAGLAIVAGRIARIVNYYDGPKTPRSLDGWSSLGQEVGELHRELAAIAHACGIDLAAAVDAKLDAIPPRDSGRFARRREDPATAASLEGFRALSLEPARPALGLEPAHARLWGTPPWLEGPFERNIDAIAAALVSFTKAAALERLDAYVIAGPSCTSVKRLREWLEQLLSALSARDPTLGRAPSLARVTRTGAHEAEHEQPHARAGASEVAFTFNGASLAVHALSPAHPAGHPRHSPAGTFAALVVRRPPA